MVRVSLDLQVDLVASFTVWVLLDLRRGVEQTSRISNSLSVRIVLYKDEGKTSPGSGRVYPFTNVLPTRYLFSTTIVKEIPF